MESQTADSKAQELEKVKNRLEEIEEEADALLQMKAELENKIGGAKDDSADADADALRVEKEEVDSRSIYVGNVDYACTAEEVQQHFQSCGTVNRVTIMTDEYGQPKGFAYVEFLETEAVEAAITLNESELLGRRLKVSAKRTNIPGMKQYRARGPNRYFGASNPFMPDQPSFPRYGYGRFPRFRRPNRYRPY